MPKYTREEEVETWNRAEEAADQRRTAERVQALRTLSGSGLLDCKAALDEANGEPLRALLILRRKGHAVYFSNPETRKRYFTAEDWREVLR